MHAVSAWQPSRDESCDPGWMLPLVIFARTYSTFLSTFGDDYMYRLQQPLPLTELYQPNQSRGLLSLLKFAMWQVLSVPPHHLAQTCSWLASSACCAVPAKYCNVVPSTHEKRDLATGKLDPTCMEMWDPLDGRLHV